MLSTVAQGMKNLCASACEMASHTYTAFDGSVRHYKYQENRLESSSLTLLERLHFIGSQTFRIALAQEGARALTEALKACGRLNPVEAQDNKTVRAAKTFERASAAYMQMKEDQYRLESFLDNDLRALSCQNVATQLGLTVDELNSAQGLEAFANKYFLAKRLAFYFGQEMRGGIQDSKHRLRVEDGSVQICRGNEWVNWNDLQGERAVTLGNDDPYMKGFGRIVPDRYLFDGIRPSPPKDYKPQFEQRFRMPPHELAEWEADVQKHIAKLNEQTRRENQQIRGEGQLRSEDLETQEQVLMALDQARDENRLIREENERIRESNAGIRERFENLLKDQPVQQEEESALGAEAEGIRAENRSIQAANELLQAGEQDAKPPSLLRPLLMPLIEYSRVEHLFAVDICTSSRKSGARLRQGDHTWKIVWDCDGRGWSSGLYRPIKASGDTAWSKILTGMHLRVKNARLVPEYSHYCEAYTTSRFWGTREQYGHQMEEFGSFLEQGIPFQLVRQNCTQYELDSVKRNFGVDLPAEQTFTELILRRPIASWVLKCWDRMPEPVQKLSHRASALAWNFIQLALGASRVDEPITDASHEAEDVVLAGEAPLHRRSITQRLSDMLWSCAHRISTMIKSLTQPAAHPSEPERVEPLNGTGIPRTPSIHGLRDAVQRAIYKPNTSMVTPYSLGWRTGPALEDYRTQKGDPLAVPSENEWPTVLKTWRESQKD